MANEVKKDLPDDSEDETKGKVSGFTQFVVGELETIGGVLTGDPLTQAEGEFNVEVGTVREDIEEDLEESERANDEDEHNS
jgi:uncharacterized protein YjbJ (UPF0337 family)